MIIFFLAAPIKYKTIKFPRFQVLSLQRAFLLPDPFDPDAGLGVGAGPVRDMSFGPVRGRNLAEAVAFPGLLALLDGLSPSEQQPQQPQLTVEEANRRKEALRRHISDLVVAAHQAAEMMWDFHVL